MGNEANGDGKQQEQAGEHESPRRSEAMIVARPAHGVKP
jgi:hypothetical protein